MFATDLADFDNDGLLGIISQSFGAGNGVRVYRNHGDGTWTQEWAETGSNVYYTLETGDFDADGNTDFICTRDNTYAYFGDGAFGFTLDQGGLPPNYMLAVATGLPDNCRFQWTVPQVNSTTCRMRITATAGGHTHQYVSPEDFSVLQGVGINEEASAPVFQAELTVSPNPGSGTQSVNVAQGLAGELRVFDIAGRQVIGTTVSGGAAYPLLALDGNEIPAGVYVAVLNTPSRTLSTVFVKLR